MNNVLPLVQPNVSVPSPGPARERDEIQREISELVTAYFTVEHERPFIAGRSPVLYAGAVFDQREVIPMIETLLRGWLGVSSRAHEFERAFAPLFGKSHGLVTNSGSSANLLALSTLTSRRLPRPLQRNDEVITCALAFPTTVNPIIQCGLLPVFVDAQSGSYNIDVQRAAEAITPRTRAIAFAHALGNPADMNAISELAKRHDLSIIEDCCDALGSEYAGRPVGSFGTLSTVSFYPSHHMTMGEGGFVASDDALLATVARSLRDWGRDCHCVGQATLLKNGSCGSRFDCWLGRDTGTIDHKYVYSEIGYNLKPLEIQCAMGLAQMQRLPAFAARRQENFDALYELTVRLL